MSQSRPRVIVTGYVGYIPIGGVAWDYLQYAVGLSRLGYEVYYHEDTLEWPYHPIQQERTRDAIYSARYIEAFFRKYAPDLLGRWHYFHLREKSFGMPTAQFNEIARTADIFLNISGASFIPDGLATNCLKVFVDTDPGYNQIRMMNKMQQTSKVPGFLSAHDHYFTYAENIHSADCLLPTFGVKWKTTRMPVVISLWKNARGNSTAGKPWTTVLTWSEFKGQLVLKGVAYEGKAMEFEKIISLPQRLDYKFKIAVGGSGAPLEQMKQNGWDVLHGPTATRTPAKYKQFIINGRGEISIAKNVYVALRTGWFSCRSACYLAAGRPVVVQDTGFANAVPSGRGIRIFHDFDEAARAIADIESDYETHANAAYELAHEYFDSTKVLTKLFNDLQV